jgi:beta-galactosidase
MKRNGSICGRSTRLAWLAGVGLIVGFSLFSAAARDRISLDANWTFQLGDPSDVTTNVTYYPEISDLAKLDAGEVGAGNNTESYMESIRVDIFATHAGENVSFVQTNYNDSGWRQLNLPHDWAEELPFNSSADVGHGYKPVGGSAFTANNIGWYRRTFTLPSNYAGQSLWLEFDGVYRNCLVWLNGHILGRNVSGYSSFYFDATPYANPGGTNVLVVRVDASRFEGWFYEGAGIYRHVWLTAENPVHVAEWGTYVATTALAGSNATITVQTDVTNQSNVSTSAGTLTSTIYDANSNAVATVTSPVSVPPGQDLVVTQTLALANARLWSLETPYLYNLGTMVSNQNAVADNYTTPFGARMVWIDSTNGVSINGQHVWLQGMCNHQDMAGVGSALPDALQYYRIERLKEMGVNAYRTSHNAPTPELLNACDRLGMLVLDENRRLGTNAEPLSELCRQIRRDRNHPSVFMWSLANEEWDMQGSATGQSIMNVMQNLVHSLDSTRKCTAAINGGLGGTGFSAVLDVQGLNYNDPGSLDGYHPGNPTNPIIGTETSSEVGDRGMYTNDTSNGYVWGYDLENSGVGWGQSAEGWWQDYYARPWASGGFCWTGFDYRGEPTPYWWPCINSHFGIMDVCGFPKDLFYYYQANWTVKPVLHLFPHWNWQTPGQPINVWAFGNCQAVELFVNGVSQGRQSLNVQGHVEWDNVPYAPGTLQAIGYNGGAATITNTIVTTGAPASIALIPDRNAIMDDGRDVSVVTVEVLDSQGRVAPTASNLVQFTITGGAILGVANGDPSSHQADKASQRSVFNGLAEVIVQSTNQPGSISLTATSAGLVSTNITITETAALPPPAAPACVAAVAGNAQVAVSWDIVPGAATYNLWRATTSGGPYTLIAGNIGGVNLGYVDANATNLTKYYYVVTANGAYTNGTSANSAEVSALPSPVVSGLTASVANSQILLNWNASPGASYNVKRSLVSGGPYTAIAGPISSTTYTDANVVSCQPYYYAITITNAGYESPPSTEAVAELPGGAPPSPWLNTDIGSVGETGGVTYCPGQFTVSGSGSDIWNTADAFQFVYVYLSNGTNCDIRARVDSVQNTSGSAKAGVMIRESLAANAANALVDVTPSAGIELLWRSSTGGSTASTVHSGQTAPSWVRLTLTNNTFTGYWSPDGNTWNQIGTAPSSFVSTGAYVGLAVCAHNNAALNTSMLDQVSISGLTSTNINPPAAPTGLGATAGTGQVALTWTASSGATSYNVKRSTSSGGETTITNVTGVNYTDTNVVNGTTYYYKVSAVNAYGESTNSTEVSAMPQAQAPPTPSGLGATAGTGQVVLTWTASTGATSYNVKRSTTSGGETTITNVTGVTYTDTNVVNGTTYYYMVSATNASGESVNSGEVSAMPQAQQIPGITALINFEADKAVPNPTNGLYWNNIGVGFYQNDSSSTLSKISENGGTSATSVGLVDTGNVNDGWFLSISNCANGAVHGNGNEMASSVFNTSQTAIWPVVAMEDGIQFNSSAAGPDVSIYISGLNSNNTYDVLFYAGDNNNSYTQTSTLVNCGNATQVSFAYNIKQATNYCSWSNVRPTNGVMILTLSLPGNGDWGAMNCMELIQNMPAAIGGIAPGAISGKSLTLNWTANANVHLQSATNLAPPVVWTDVPNTTGQGSATITTTNIHLFFRLIQP